MESTSEFLQVYYYHYLGICSNRHWHPKPGISTQTLLRYKWILCVFIDFYPNLSFIFILLGCWILPRFKAESVVTEYLWVWLAAIFMIIFYGIMFASIRRWINIAHGIHWYNQPWRKALDRESDDDKKIKAVANSMLLLVHFFV
jgi:hypothetical protein